MKKILTALFILVITGSALAVETSRTANGLTEAEQLGITAGTALACNAGGKLDDFELIASRIIANKALTKADENKGYHEFAEAKFRAYNEQRENPQIPCGDVLASFSRLPIFKSVVYADGGVKMYDGSYLKPQRSIMPNKKKEVKKKK